MIDKKIYYFWTGGDLPRYAKSCMETWKRFMPDFEIVKIPEDYVDMNIEWNQKAYKDKKWTYLSDTARINFLKTHSGIYLDTDMFLCKRIPDEMLNASLVMACEDNEWVSQGIIIKDNTEEVNKLFEDWYNIYCKQKTFKYSVDIFQKLLWSGIYDIQSSNNVYVNKDNMRFYGVKYFSPVNINFEKPVFGDETVIIDLCTTSFLKDSIKNEDKEFFNKYIKLFKDNESEILEFLKTRNCDDLYNRDYNIDYDEW